MEENHKYNPYKFCSLIHTNPLSMLDYTVRIIVFNNIEVWVWLTENEERER